METVVAMLMHAEKEMIAIPMEDYEESEHVPVDLVVFTPYKEILRLSHSGQVGHDQKEEHSCSVHLEDDHVPVDLGVAGEEVLDQEANGNDLKERKALYFSMTLPMWTWLWSQRGRAWLLPVHCMPSILLIHIPKLFLQTTFLKFSFSRCPSSAPGRLWPGRGGLRGSWRLSTTESLSSPWRR